MDEEELKKYEKQNLVLIIGENPREKQLLDLSKHRLRERRETFYAFHKLAKDVAMERNVYYENIEDGILLLKPKWYPS